MPANMTWPRYITFIAVAYGTMLAGSQIVHNYYKPLADLEDLVEKALQQRLKQMSETGE